MKKINLSTEQKNRLIRAISLAILIVPFSYLLLKFILLKLVNFFMMRLGLMDYRLMNYFDKIIIIGIFAWGVFFTYKWIKDGNFSINDK